MSPKASQTDQKRLLNIHQLVTPQPGSVVSRTLLKQKNGTITLFAFDQGGGLSEHSAPFDVLFHVLEGTVSLTLSGTTHQLDAGQGLLMPAHEPHALTALSPLKLLLVMIRAEG